MRTVPRFGGGDEVTNDDRSSAARHIGNDGVALRLRVDIVVSKAPVPMHCKRKAASKCSLDYLLFEPSPNAVSASDYCDRCSTASNMPSKRVMGLARSIRKLLERNWRNARRGRVVLLSNVGFMNSYVISKFSQSHRPTIYFVCNTFPNINPAPSM